MFIVPSSALNCIDRAASPDSKEVLEKARTGVENLMAISRNHAIVER
jgi:hypothetical protein